MPVLNVLNYIIGNYTCHSNINRNNKSNFNFEYFRYQLDLIKKCIKQIITQIQLFAFHDNIIKDNFSKEYFKCQGIDFSLYQSDNFGE